MKSKTLLLLFVSCLSITKFYGQNIQADSSIVMSYEINSTKDTVWLSANILNTTKPGTLMIVSTISNSTKTDTAFFPIFDSASEFVIVIPEEYRKGVLSIKAFFYPKIFQVTGKVLERIKNKKIDVLVMTDNKKIYNKELKLSDENEFKLPELVFTNKASLIFSYISSEERAGHPDIEIEQTPSVSNITENVFTASIPLVASIVPVGKNAPVNFSSIPAEDSTDKFKILNSVTVTGKRKTNAEKFNDEYVTPIFDDINERVIDCIDNKNILSYPDCLSYLRARVPGLTGNIDKFGENILMWRGHETKAFFIDEIPVDINELLSINVADIAIIKAFPPPYSGIGGNGNGGAIAIYTRRGEFKTPQSSDNKWLFSVKGYSPAEYTLFSGN